MAVARDFLLVCAALLAGAAHAQGFSVLPPNPVAGEEFVLKVVSGFHAGGEVQGPLKAEVIGSTIELTRDTDRPAATGAHVVPLVGIPAGSYTAVFRAHPTVAAFGIGPVVVHSATTPVAAPRGLTGNWFDPEENGWGLNIVQGDSGQLFIVWFDYEPNVDGAAPRARTASTWIVVPGGRWLNGSTFRGLAYKTSTGSNPDYRYLAPAIAAIGFVSVVVEGPDEVTMRASLGSTLSDIHKLKRLRRQPL